MSDSPKPDNQTSQVATTETTSQNVQSPSVSSQTTTLREDLIKSAVSFLTSPNVRAADKGKKIAFLQKKGLNQTEIDEAFKRAGSEADSLPTSTTIGNTTTTTTTTTPPMNTSNNYTPAPALPSRNVNYGPPQIVYYPQPPNPPVPVEKVFAMAVVLGMSAVGLTAGVIGILRRFIGPIFNRIATYQRTRYNQRKEIGEKVDKSIKSFDTENDDLDALIDQGEENTVAEALIKNQTELSNKIEQLAKSSRELLLGQLTYKTCDDIKNEITSLKTVITETNPSHYGSYHPSSFRQNNDSPGVSGLKSDIRSLKAVLLNRRNFPTAA